ncbi:hypothetical protein BDW75DRAFT_235901 [Aspergillus navahoensis]
MALSYEDEQTTPRESGASNYAFTLDQRKSKSADIALVLVILLRCTCCPRPNPTRSQAWAVFNTGGRSQLTQLSKTQAGAGLRVTRFSSTSHRLIREYHLSAAPSSQTTSENRCKLKLEHVTNYPDSRERERTPIGYARLSATLHVRSDNARDGQVAGFVRETDWREGEKELEKQAGNEWLNKPRTTGSDFKFTVLQSPPYKLVVIRAP